MPRKFASVPKNDHSEWIESFKECYKIEKVKVVDPEVNPGEGYIRMGEVVDAVSRITKGKAIIVTDVGQNQMIAARYSRFSDKRSMITSGGLGTMGFGIPAAIGAKTAAPERTVCLFVGDGGMQMTIEELGTIMQEHTGVKIILMNNNWLGNVRQWQELFFDERYSATRMLNPDYCKIAAAYGIKSALIEKREDLEPRLREALANDDPYILDIHVIENGLVMPMIPPGKSINEIMLNSKEWFEYGK